MSAGLGFQGSRLFGEFPGSSSIESKYNICKYEHTCRYIQVFLCARRVIPPLDNCP